MSAPSQCRYTRPGTAFARVPLMQTLRVITVTACLAFALAGCSQPKNTVDRGPQLDADGNRRSVVLQTPLQQYLQERETASADLPWYADRNDRMLAADAGYASPTFQDSVTYTRDRQYQSGGRVYDHFSSTTYRVEHHRAVR